MRYTKYITTLFALIAISACTIADIDNQVTVGNTAKDDKIQVLGRITRFADVDVSTRGVKDQDEAKLTSMALAIFKVNAAGDGLDGNCVYYQYADDQAELLFTIERGSNYDYDTRYAMYVFCNMPGMQTETMGVGTSLSEMMAAFYNVENIDIPANGFPMMGSLGDTFSTTFDKDGRVFVLSPRENGDLTTPKVDGVTQTLLTIPMKAMYAKVNFTIEVDPDQTIDGNYSPQFTLEGYTVNNVPSTVDFDNSSNDDAAVLADSYSLPISGNTVASGANKINFTFYLPERYLEPATKPADYAYPFKNDGKIRGEDSVYMQRYKPELVGDKKATNVVISGRFRDHQTHHWDVKYTIYLGEDNYGDFNIKRNCEYHNYITIRGIQSSSDMSDNENAISIDHRVNVERTQPAIISLRRETLLDSHFEVRPLRVIKSDVSDPSINAVKVEVVNPGTTDWMRLERSFGDGTPEGSPQTTVNGSATSIYIDSDATSASYGKRKFFTYNLIDGVNANATDASLVNSTEVILPITEATECCWIYIDECTEVGDAVRSGIVKVSYGKLEGTTFTPANNSAYPDVQYIINQRKLFQVTYDDPETTAEENRTYNIEYEEEYLHNFDADDNFGQTEYEGMQWGLLGVQLSYDINAVQISGTGFADIKNDIASNYAPYYDFYITKHDAAIMTNAENRRDYSGFIFTTEIIQEINGATNNDTDTSNDINVLQLDEDPKSAIEYCFNKNKRNNKGQVVWQNTDGTYDQSQLNWYLPAIDEIEDIVMSKYGNNLNTYARFLDFQNKYYWSSQPSYFNNYMHYSIGQWVFIWINADDYGSYSIDDTSRARATRVRYDEAKGYVYDESGTTGYYNILVIDGQWILGNRYIDLFNLPEQLANAESFTYEYNDNGEPDRYKGSKTFTKDDLPAYQSGNRPRTSMARVRCVRKIDTTTTE